MGKKKKEKKLTLQAAALSAVGIAGTVLWQKKDLLKAIIQLRQYPEGWVLIQKEPEVFLTKISEASKDNLFTYLDKSPWRFVDQVADGYFWMNSQEEILLLTQKKVLGDYWSWTASRPFFTGTVPADRVADNGPQEQVIDAAEYDYDLTEEAPLEKESITEAIDTKQEEVFDSVTEKEVEQVLEPEAEPIADVVETSEQVLEESETKEDQGTTKE